MTVFLGASPQQTPDSSTHFHVFAAAEPSVLARVISLFAKLALMPDVFHSARTDVDMLRMDISLTGLSAEQSEHIARALRQIIEIDTVLIDFAEQGYADEPARAEAG